MKSRVYKIAECSKRWAWVTWCIEYSLQRNGFSNYQKYFKFNHSPNETLDLAQQKKHKFKEMRKTVYRLEKMYRNVAFFPAFK